MYLLHLSARFCASGLWTVHRRLRGILRLHSCAHHRGAHLHHSALREGERTIFCNWYLSRTRRSKEVDEGEQGFMLSTSGVPAACRGSEPFSPSHDACRWICCQIGAREHYMVPRALASRNALGLLVTDVWAGRRRGLISLPMPRFQGRFHPELRSAPIAAWNIHTVWFETVRSRQRGWQRILARNRWYQGRALVALRSYRKANPKQRVVLFGYSYASLRLFEFARDVGWTTVLGQIDPGLTEERLVGALHRRCDAALSEWEPAPPEYWAQ